MRIQALIHPAKNLRNHNEKERKNHPMKFKNVSLEKKNIEDLKKSREPKYLDTTRAEVKEKRSLKEIIGN